MLFHQLVYTSRAMTDISNETLLEILTKSQHNNYRYGISGLLIFNNGRFIQLLEGRVDDVRNVFASIYSDTRHSDIKVLLEVSEDDRCMPMWTMGFCMTGNIDVEFRSKNFFITIEDCRAICQQMPENIGVLFQHFLAAEEP